MLKRSVIISLVLAALILSSYPFISEAHIEDDDLEFDFSRDETVIIPESTFTISGGWEDGRYWTFIDLENGIHPPSDGGPSLPYLSHPLRVNYEIEDIRIVRSDPMTIQIDHPIAPTQKILPMRGEALAGTGMDIDPLEYSNGVIHPSDALKWAHMGYGWETGEKLSHYSVSICPFDHDPTTSSLVFYRDIELQIDKKMENVFLEYQLNTVRAVSKPSQVDEGTELLVIAYDPFVNDLSPYTNWKMEKGLKVSVVKYSLIDQYGGKSGHQAIWQFIHDTYFGDDRNLKWVLLAGETKYVPTLMAHDQDPYGNEPSTLPADTYYACLDGTSTNWNSDGDARWAETGDISDYIPEVYVSRVSTDTDTETLNWANKVVAYEKNPETGSWPSRATFFGSTTHEYDDGPRQSEYLWNQYLDVVYDTPDRYYSAGNVQQSVGASTLTAYNAKGAVNSGSSVVVYMGHGFYGMWSEGTQNNGRVLLTTSDAAGFSQYPRLPFITAMSCETNWYDNGNWDSISEAFIENANGGAIGYVGASRTTEGGIGYYEYLPGAPGIQEDVLRMMKNGKRHQAEIFHEAKEYYADSWGSWFGVYEFAYNAYVEHNILGSPETELWTDSLSTFSVDVDFTRDHYSNFTVTVRDSSNNAVAGAKVVVFSEGTKCACSGLTDQTGVARIPFTITEPSYAKVTVTGTNFKPYQKQFYLSDDTDPVTEVHFAKETPDGSGGWYRSDPTITFTCSEPGETNYRWNGGSDHEFRGTVQVPKGDNILEYWTEDLFGNEEGLKQVSVKYDPDTPELVYEVVPDSPDGHAGWYSTQPVVTTSILGNEASPHRVDYWYGRGTKQVSNGTIYVMQGDNDLHLQALDEAGNIDEEVTISFRVDSIYPVTELSTDAGEPNELGWHTSYMTVELYCDDRTAETFYRWGEGEDFLRYDDPIVPPLGDNILEYYSVDSHGNREPSKYMPVKYDNIAPHIITDVSPAGPDGENGWYVTSPMASFSTDGDTSQETIYYYFDNGLPAEYLRPMTIPEGESSLFVYAVDQAGNRGPTKDLHFKIDTQVEETDMVMDSSPDDNGWITDIPMIILRSGDDSTIYYSWDGSNDFRVYNGGIIPPGEEGEYLLTYYSVDLAGNKEKDRTKIFYIDAKGPETIITGPPSANQGDTVTFDLSRTSDGSGVDEYYIDFGDGTNSGWVSSPQISHKYSKGGTFQVKAKSRDIVGHESEERSFEMIIYEKADDKLVLYAGLGLGVLVLILVILVIALIVSKEKRHLRHVHDPEAYRFLNGSSPRGTHRAHGHAPANNNGKPGLRHQHMPQQPGNANVQTYQRPNQTGKAGTQNYQRPHKPVTQGTRASKPAPTPPPPPRMPEIPQPPKPPV